MNKSINKLSTVEQISYLERFILIHSIVYYEFDNNVISDKTYDEYAKYLEKLIKLNDKEFKESQYYYAFTDYSSATGFDLRSKLNEKDNEYLTHLAYNVLKHGKTEKL